MPNFGGYTPDDAAEIHRRVLNPRFAQPVIDNAKDLTVLNRMYYVKMLSALAAATDPYTGYTQAYGQVVRYVQPNNNTLDMEDAVNTDSKFLVTNRSTTFSAAVDDHVLIIRNISEWTPLNAGASTTRHAKVTECLGGGYYRGELATATFSLPIDYTAGTASNSSTGTGTGTGDNPCGPCEDVILSGDPASCDEVVQPTRVSVVGDGVNIFMYDPRPTPLLINGHVIVMDLGDTTDATAAGVLTGTGTGTGGDNPKIWMVVNGNYPVVGIPDRYYECCNGVVILTRCDLYIVEGVMCPGETVPCVVGTGTA